jgi:DNA-binding response OmpR family regulator
MERILIVEDDERERQSLAELLGAHYEVSSAPNGKVALRLLQEKPVELLITDMVMPEMDGVETIVAVRRQYPAVKIMAVSDGGVVSSNHYLRLAQNLGAQSTLAKPFSASEILGAIEGLLAPRGADFR